jgi:hypothetical protein
MISRVRAGFVGAFRDKAREDVGKLGRIEGGFERGASCAAIDVDVAAGV